MQRGEGARLGVEDLLFEEGVSALDAPMTQINPIAQLNEMLQRRDFGAVLALTDTLLRKSQNNASAWHARARSA